MKRKKKALSVNTSANPSYGPLFLSATVGRDERLGGAQTKALQIEEGHMGLSREYFQALAALDEILGSAAVLATARRIRIENSVESELSICADRVRFKQILYNLLSNAIKFTPEGGEVRVDSFIGDSEVHFSVTDTGVGIPAEELDAIFDGFHQSAGAASDGPEGTGLGLMITRRLVEQHGGRIWVESKPGNGSRFTFTLPA
jgi:signal transduction histidine kinase